MKTFLKSKPWIVLVYITLFLCCSFSVNAQQKIIWDKPGSFKIDNNGIYLGGADNNGIAYSYTKTQADLNYKNLVSLINVFGKTPVLAQPKGFDELVVLYSIGYNPKFDYGIPCRVNICFETWFDNKGKVYKHIYEPPQWYFTINRTSYYAPTSSFNVSNWDAYNANNPLFNKVKADKATKALRELFWAPGKRDSIAHGIDLYNDQYIFYNPECEPYWLPVTIREVFKLYKQYWELAPDSNTAHTMLNALQNEYSEFSEEEMDEYAYAKGGESIFRIGNDKSNRAVMRANPGYWNRKIPSSSIQFMVLEIPPKDELVKKMKKCFENDDGYYFVSRMLDELNLLDLVDSIDK